MSIRKELIDTDPDTGVSTWYEEYQDGDRKKFRIAHSQDVGLILDRNTNLQNADEYKRTGIKNGFQHVAHIPDIVQIQWLREGIDVLNPQHLPKVLAKLRDPEWRKLRTTLGRI